MEEKYEVTSEKIEQLEREVVEAKNIADVSVRRAEEVVRKLVLAEHNKDRTEEKAAVCEEKIRRLQEELHHLNKGVSSLASSGTTEIDDNVQDTIREMKKKISEAEVQAETSERAAVRLQQEVDTLQVSVAKSYLHFIRCWQGRLMEEREASKRAEEDMENLVISLNNI